MKRDLKLHIAKIMLAIGGVSTIAESCNKECIESSIGRNSFSPNEDLGLSLMPISYYLPEDVNLQGMTEFCIDIINDEELQSRFSQSPEQVLSEYGIGGFDRNSPQIQALLAMGDKDVVEAIEQGNFEKYLKVLESKHYLQSNIIKKMKAQYQNGIMAKTKSSVQYEECCLVFVPVVLFVAVAAVAVVALEAEIWIDLAVDVRPSAINSINSLMNDDAIVLYIDKTKSLSTVEIDEEEYVSYLRKAISSYDDLSPDDAEIAFQISCGTVDHLINEE